MKALRRFLAEWQALLPSRPAGAEPPGKLQELLREFQDRIERHSHLEEAVVFPRAAVLEKTLYDRAISGTASESLPETASFR
jgi:hypothetical protein